MGTPKLTRYTMNTFHLASLALLVGLISAAPTSTYPHVDAVVPEIEFPVDEGAAPTDDNAVYNLVTFKIDPKQKPQFEEWIKKLANQAYMCEMGTYVYDVYNGQWQVKKKNNAMFKTNNGAVRQGHPNTYTIFEKFANAEMAKKHGDHVKGTAIWTWRTQRNSFGTTDPKTHEKKLELTVRNPTAKEFDIMRANSDIKAVVQPRLKDEHATECAAYQLRKT